MKTVIWLTAAALMLLTTPAMAQPSDGCPDDVGAVLAAACPCGADSNAQAWTNHGQYVKCVVQLRNDLRRRGCLDSEAKRTIARCAARSTCGKEGAVLCCVYDTSGTCEGDAVPGDGTAAGGCSNATETACDTDTDCITARGPKVTRQAEQCTARGGTAIGTGSVCSACPIPPPAP